MGLQTGEPQSCSVASDVCVPQNAGILPLCCLALPLGGEGLPGAGPAACAMLRCVWQTVHDQPVLALSDSATFTSLTPGEPGSAAGVTQGSLALFLV